MHLGLKTEDGIKDKGPRYVAIVYIITSIVCSDHTVRDFRARESCHDICMHQSLATVDT